MNLVCLDSMYFIWALLKKARPSQMDKIPQAEEFFERLNKQDVTIVVPTPLVQELLMDAEEAERPTILAALNGKFHVAEYDAACAMKAAEIWNIRKRQGVIAEIKASGVSLRTKMKIDVQLLATAIQNGASIFYTNDGDLAKLAAGYIVVADMPAVKKQLELDLLPTPSSPPIASPQPSLQSPVVARRRGIEPGQPLPSVLPADPEPPQPGFSVLKEQDQPPPSSGPQ